MELVLGIIGLVIGGAVMVQRRQAQRARERQLAEAMDVRAVRCRELAGRLGLTQTEAVGGRTVWEGRIDGLGLYLSSTPTRVSLRLATPRPTDGPDLGRFVISPPRPGVTDDGLGIPEHLTTQGVATAGTVAIALLTAEGRTLLAEFVNKRMGGPEPKLFWGEVTEARIEANELADDDAASWEGLLDRMLADCRAVADHIAHTQQQLPERLAEVEAEGLTPLRELALEKLLTTFPELSLARTVAARVLEDGARPLASRLLAAATIGAEADQLVLDLFASTRLAGRDQRLMREAFGMILSRTPHSELAHMFSAAIGPATDPALLLWLAGEVVDRELADPSRGTALEEELIRVLDDDVPERAIAAARHLGELGTATSVGPLRAVRASGAPKVARESVQQIQSRLRHASPGQLSMAAAPADGAGGLSEADDAVGGVSLEGESAG